MRRMRRLLPLLALGALLAACYNPNLTTGSQQCATGSRCPAGFVCEWDNHCYKPGTAPVKPVVIVDLGVTVVDMAIGCTKATCMAPAVCDPISGQCVGCVVDTDCPDGKLCKARTCVGGCSALHGCGDAGACELDAGLCKTCSGDGECAGDTPRCDGTSGRCVPCLPMNDNCPVGSFCGKVNAAFLCQMGCKVDNDCPGAPDGGMGDSDGGAPVIAKLACCDHVCTDVNSDGKNCGKCGAACGNLTCCTGACADTAKDLANCGACGRACKGGNALWSCAQAACAVSSCNGTFRDCNMNAADGCEANITTDGKNCLGCGKACAVNNGVGGCANGCTIQSCDVGFADCDKNIVNGCEVGTAADLANCGACGKVCSTPNNATPGCANGACGVGACKPGFGDCDQNPGNGCEAILASDPNHCSKCGMKCPAPMNGVGACGAGVCGIGGCTGVFKDCNMSGLDGCEVNTGTDLKNCGVCGKACAAVANGVAACSGAVCGIGSCNGAFKDCNSAVNDGCEIDSNADISNCKACGNKCAAIANGVAGCSAGACGIASCNGAFKDCNSNSGDGCEIDTATNKNNCGVCAKMCGANLVCKAGVCGAISQDFGPIHSFAGLMSDFYISTGQGGCSVNNMQNKDIDAQYFCAHFYFANCTPKPGYAQTTLINGIGMHKNLDCTPLGLDIQGKACDGGACKIWNFNGSGTLSGLKGLICTCP
ncbi:MAG: hypothetical protein EXR72_13810 [Myxococcales bacterium]|nr:hypothetical protein [Myxococcales bacterium]